MSVSKEEKVEIIQEFIDGFINCCNRHLEEANNLISETYSNIGKGLGTGSAMSFLAYMDRQTHLFSYDAPNLINSYFDEYKTTHELSDDIDLQYYVDQAHVTKRFLAKKCGCTEASMGRYIKGTRTPNIDTAYTICKHLGIGIEEFNKAFELSKKKNLK